MDEVLVIDNINFLQDYIPKLLNAIEDMADLLISNNETTSLKLFTSIVEGLDWSIRSIRSLESLGVVSDLKLDELCRIIIETEQTFSKKDYVLLADLLQYEIAEILENWKLKLKDLAGE